MQILTLIGFNILFVLLICGYLLYRQSRRRSALALAIRDFVKSAGGMAPYEVARSAYLNYPMEPALPPNRMSALQVQIARWAEINLGKQTDIIAALGISEESGEFSEAVVRLSAAVGRISHITLKRHHKIRNYDDAHKALVDISDAIADLMVFCTQLCNQYNLDFGTLYEKTIENVMRRNWVDNPQNANVLAEQAHSVTNK